MDTHGKLIEIKMFTFGWECDECNWSCTGGGYTADSWWDMERKRVEHLMNEHGIKSKERKIPKKYCSADL